MKITFWELIRISRPRFWLYLFWPILIAIATSGVIDRYFLSEDINWLLCLFVCIYLLYFLFPANLLIYGVNDLCDEDTDQWNEKKWDYENKLIAWSKRSLIKYILLRNIPFLVILWWQIVLTWSWLIWYWKQSVILWMICIFLFYFTGIFYSSLPVRAKAKPFLDGLFNVLYILPWFALYHFIALESTFHRIWFFTAWSRCIAMHSFSAIPDIEADKMAGLTTTAVLLWKNMTLVYCLFLRLIAALGGFFYNPYFWILVWIVYSMMICLSFQWSVFKIYKWFPLINWIIWFVLFWLIVLSQ